MTTSRHPRQRKRASPELSGAPSTRNADASTSGLRHRLTGRCFGWGLVGIALFAFFGLAWWAGSPLGTEKRIGSDDSAHSQTNLTPDPPLTAFEASSPFLNTGAGAKFVGSEACRECHADEHASYHLTGMGRATSLVELSREPPDGGFDHPLSHRRFEVRRREEQIWHRELWLDEGREEVVLSEYPVKYVVGSGNHSLSYLVEEDGFLMESPITWYTATKSWGISPGYDQAEHKSFERETGESCLGCHVGSLETLDRSMHRVNIREGAISCEQCHGPGSIHVAHRTKSARDLISSDEIDYTIVNPRHLSRALSEAICEQCHLQSAASILRQGTKLADFRPGERMEKFRLNFRLSSAKSQMTVVGHAEQMHLSRCYQGSESFSCLTCHHPHATTLPDSAAYNAICQRCHAPARCGLPEDVRREQSPEDDCVHCHMPKTETNIPHFAFTHHRVGIHRPESIEPPPSSTTEDSAGTLVPFGDLSRIGARERQRAFGLAFIEASTRETSPAVQSQYLRQAMSLLTQLPTSDQPDGTVAAWLARLRSDAGMKDAASYAEQALADPTLAGQDRCNALFLLADARFRAGQYESALSYLQELQTLRRHSLQWLMQAACEERLGRSEDAVNSLVKAVHINPRLTDVHQHLADVFRQRGDTARADYYARRARRSR